MLAQNNTSEVNIDGGGFSTMDRENKCNLGMEVT
jgi:hypothetical protein